MNRPNFIECEDVDAANDVNLDIYTFLEGSPPGGSILITSAPKSPSTLPQKNPFSSVRSRAR